MGVINNTQKLSVWEKHKWIILEIRSQHVSPLGYNQVITRAVFLFGGSKLLHVCCSFGLLRDFWFLGMRLSLFAVSGGLISASRDCLDTIACAPHLPQSREWQIEPPPWFPSTCFFFLSHWSLLLPLPFWRARVIHWSQHIIQNNLFLRSVTSFHLQSPFRHVR